MASLLSKALCKTTGHKWIGCKCSRCGEIRDEGHTFLQIEGKCEQRCSVCDKYERLPHQWNGNICRRCGTVKGIADRLREFSNTHLSFLHLEKKNNRILLGLSLLLVIMFAFIGIMANMETNDARDKIPHSNAPTDSIQTDGNQTGKLIIQNLSLKTFNYRGKINAPTDSIQTDGNQTGKLIIQNLSLKTFNYRGKTNVA